MFVNSATKLMVNMIATCKKKGKMHFWGLYMFYNLLTASTSKYYYTPHRSHKVHKNYSWFFFITFPFKKRAYDTRNDELSMTLWCIFRYWCCTGKAQVQDFQTCGKCHNASATDTSPLEMKRLQCENCKSTKEAFEGLYLGIWKWFMTFL